MASSFEFATPLNYDDVVLMEFLAGGATGATGSTGTQGVNYVRADPTQAAFPSLENRSATALNGVAGGVPYLPPAATRSPRAM